MSSVLESAEVRRVLDRLRDEGQEHDTQAKRLVAARRRGDASASALERAEICVQAPIAISETVGRLLFLMARSKRPARVVEFGASLGVSTIYLAAALRGSPGSHLITTEIHPAKAAAVEANLAQAGLGHLVEVRVGDALQTLRDLDEPIDLLFLDGWNDFYLPVLELVRPSLARDALVIADLSVEDPDLDPYLAAVRDRESWISITVPFDAGVELSAPASAC